MNSTSKLLGHTSFSILLALSLKPRHGYELMRQIDSDSNGNIQLGPGALYGKIKYLNQEGLIEEIPGYESSRRHYYRLTRKGWTTLEAELQYYKNTLRLAEERHLLSAER